MGIPRPSMETTNSIPRAPRPVAAVAPAEFPVEAEILQAPVAQAPVARAAVTRMPVTQAPLERDTAVDTLLAAPEQQIAYAPPRLKKPHIIEEQQPVIQASAYAASRVHGPKFRDADPISFGKASPKRYPVHGVDISRWQGNINWEKLRTQGANFAFIKATDGGDHLDPMFRKNWRAANEAGLKRGAYHFFYWCRSGAEQAEWFIRNVPKSANALPPVIDVEYNHQSSCKKRPSRETVLKKMKSFMDRIEAHYGQRPIIYTAPDFYEDNLQGAFKDYPFWLRAVAQHPSKVYPGRKWVFWQYSGTGLSKGVTGEIDLNVFNGDPSQWNGWLARAAG
ncbi:MAG: GH25 family lysozyme [Rhizobiaceae bacterium]